MLAKLGNKNFTLLAKMMSLLKASHLVSSQNVANVNTPNYRRREFKFDKALRQAMERGEASDYRNIRGWVSRPNNTPIRNNGNNVDIDMEMLSLKENARLYEVYTQIYNKKSSMIKSAIK